MTSAGSLAGVLGVPVCVEDVRVGRVAGVVGDAGLTRVLGFALIDTDGARRFLPWVATTLAEGRVEAPSRLVLFEADEIDEYARRGAVTLRTAHELTGLAVSEDGSVNARPAAVSADRGLGTSPV